MRLVSAETPGFARSRRSSLRSSRLSPRRRTRGATTAAAPATATERATGRPPKRHPICQLRLPPPRTISSSSRPTECAYGSQRPRAARPHQPTRTPGQASNTCSAPPTSSAGTPIKTSSSTHAPPMPKAGAHHHSGAPRSLGRNELRDRARRRAHSSVITPLAIRTRPITAAPITAAGRPLRPIQALNRATLSRVLSGANT